MEKDNNYFSTKPESEKMRNVANMVHDIVNVKPDETLITGDAYADVVETEESPEPEVNPVVELVVKSISSGRPKGFFMQVVQTDDRPKL